ncbi:MAG: hypothetical protein ABWY19_07460 [Marmoricola sp.]
MSWTAFHSRGETLHAVVDTANTRCDGVLPMQVPGVAENFTDEIDLVGALLLKWHARLSGNIERALMREPLNLEQAVATAWRTTAEQMPGVRLVIDRCILAPPTPEMATAMDRARVREWTRLAAAAGLANDQGAAAVEAGRRVEDLAREGRETTETPERPTAEAQGDAAPDDTPTESFVDRIKAVLAA